MPHEAIAKRVDELLTVSVVRDVMRGDQSRLQDTGGLLIVDFRFSNGGKKNRKSETGNPWWLLRLYVLSKFLEEGYLVSEPFMIQ